MKKNFGLILFLVVMISIGYAASSQAVELLPVTSFDDTWVTDTYGTGTVTVTTEGSTINLSAQGAATDYGQITFSKTETSGVIGMVATLRIDQSSNDATGSCIIGISQYVGKVNNSIIQVLISLMKEDNQNSVWYRVRSRDLTTNETTYITQGTFGNSDGGWQNGDSKTVAFARVGSEFWFSLAGAPGIIKVQVADEVTSFDGYPTVTTWADPGEGNTISGNVSGIYLIQE